MAKDQHDDLAGRISVIADNVAWMVERSPATFTDATASAASANAAAAWLLRKRQQVRLGSYASDGSRDDPQHAQAIGERNAHGIAHRFWECG